MQPLLEVDLTAGETRAIELPNDVWRRWMGGTGLGYHLLSKELRRGMRPSDPDCPVFVLPGVLTGTAAPQCSDWTIVTLNEEMPTAMCASHAHGFFGARLRHAGWDGIVIRGQAVEPVYLSIEDQHVELCSAADLWGCDVFESMRRLIGRAHDVSAAAIGQAGESRITGATVRSDMAFGNNEGSPGFAWGVKKLKAIVVRGTGHVPVVDPVALQRAADGWQAGIRSLLDAGRGITSRPYSGLRRAGARDHGLVMGKNFTDPEVGVRWATRLEEEVPKWRVEGVGSWNCERACHFHAECTTGPMTGFESSGFGGETLQECGPNLGIEDPGTSLAIAGMVDAFGLSASSVPRTIAMLMHAYAEGEIDQESTGGLDLTWGNTEAVVELLELTVERRGLGRLVALGLMETAEELGIEHRAVHMRGAGFNDHDQRAIPLMLFQSSVASGAGNTWQTMPEVAIGLPEPDVGWTEVLPKDDVARLGKAAHDTQRLKLWHDSVGTCMFGGSFAGQLELAVEAVNAVTGWDMTTEEALGVGERVTQLQRCMNIYLGYSPEEDFHMSPILFEKISHGPGQGVGLTRSEFTRARADFYALSDWSLETGMPSAEALERCVIQDEVHAMFSRE